jgi:alkylation response protein AidB-like acyl-CoA dehydrogenase
MPLQNQKRPRDQFQSVLPLARRATADRILADIRAMAPEITARIAEMERERRMPLDLVERLRSIGLFRIFAPRSHGGLELDFPTGLEIISALARVDGSVGWTAMIGCVSSIFLPSLPRTTYDQIYRNGPDVITGGSATPAGRAEAAAGGWRVNGRWPFASGCQHADVLVGFCVMTEGGKPLPGPAGAGGPPLLRAVVLPARDWQIEDTWHVAGLKGTGSHHIVLRDELVPAANFFDLANGVACLPGPLYQTVLHFLPVAHGAFALGMAEGALAELVALANTGRQQLRAHAPMRLSEIFQAELGRIQAEVRAARAFFEAQAASHWHHAVAGTLNDEGLLIQGTQAAIWVATTCVRAADSCFTLGGGGALYESSPLQRRLRDLHAAAQHAAVHQRHYVGAGKLLLDSAFVPPLPSRLPSLIAEGATAGD